VSTKINLFFVSEVARVLEVCQILNRAAVYRWRFVMFYRFTTSAYNITDYNGFYFLLLRHSCLVLSWFNASGLKP